MIIIIIYDQQKWASNTLSRLSNWFFFPSIFSMRLPQPHLIWCTPWGMKTTWSSVISLHHPLVFFFPPSLSIWKKGEPLWCNVSLCVYIRVFLPKRFSCGEGKRAHLLTSTTQPFREIVRLFSMGHYVWNNFYWCVLMGSAKVSPHSKDKFCPLCLVVSWRQGERVPYCSAKTVLISVSLASDVISLFMFERYRAAMHRASSVFCEWCRTSWKGLWEATPNKGKGQKWMEKN